MLQVINDKIRIRKFEFEVFFWLWFMMLRCVSLKKDNMFFDFVYVVGKSRYAK